MRCFKKKHQQFIDAIGLTGVDLLKLRDKHYELYCAFQISLARVFYRKVEIGRLAVIFANNYMHTGKTPDIIYSAIANDEDEARYLSQIEGN